jgi:superfamily II DNA or RNA helicase
LNRRKKTGDNLELPPFDFLFVDEAHLQKGDETRALLNELEEKYGTVIIGITATPLGISQIYRDGLIVAGNNSQLRKCGALVAATCFEPAVLDLPKVRKSKTGLFSQTELEDGVKAIWSQHVVGHVFDHWRKLNPDGMQSLGMAPGVPESRGLAQEFFRRGINSAHIDGEGMVLNGREYSTTTQEDRDEAFQMSKDGRCPIIFNRFVLREGVDMKWLRMLVLATPIASLLSYVQVVGRVLRADKGKDGAIITDHCGSIRMHGSPNLDRDKDWERYFFQDENKITRDRQERLTDPQNKEPEPITCPECGMIRKEGRVCPKCKFEHSKSVRKVIQESGQLKQMTGDVYEKRRPGIEKSDTLKKWEAIYWRCKKAKKRSPTFNQAVALFKREHGYHPPDNMPGMPINRSDFDRQVKAVPYSELHPRRAS